MTARTLLFYLGGSRSELWRAIARARDRGDLTIVLVTGRLVDEADVAGIANARLFQISDAVVDERVAHARARAWAWLEDVGYRRPTRTGATLAQLLTDAGGNSPWWLADITLQERAYLAVRLIESVEHFHRQEQPDSVTVVGSDLTHPWMGITIARWARARAIPTYWRHAASEGDEPAIPETPRSAKDIPISLAARIPSGVEDAIDLVLRLAELLTLPIVAPAMAAALILRVGLREAIGTAEGRLESGATAVLKWLRAGLILIAAMVIGLMAFIPVTIGLLALTLVLIVREDRAPRPSTIVVQLRRLVVNVNPWRAFREIQPGSRAVTRERRRRAVLAIEDRGNVKTRVDMGTGRRSTYNPYLEGVVERLRLNGGPLIVARYGSLRRRALPRRFVTRVRVLLGLTHEVVVSDEITTSIWQTAMLERARNIESGRAVGRVSGIFEYEGVPLYDALASDLERMFASLHERTLYFHAFGNLIRRLQPALVLAYNWEGVFRPLTAACVEQHVAMLGVQQALGPYGHALDHRRVGYAQPLGSDQGFPIPDRICVWGEMHLRNLSLYGYPEGTVTATGYPRLDAFVGARPSRHRILRRLRIEREDAKIVLFAPVLRVLGLPLVREVNFLRLVDELAALTQSDPSIHVVVKPWPGDELGRLNAIVNARGNRRFRLLPPENDIHNADLLASSAVLITTFSSIVGEAVVSGCTPVVVDYPECRYYFGDEHVEHYRDLARLTRDPSATMAAVRAALRLTDAERAAEREVRRTVLERVFGPVDGRSSERVASEVTRFAKAAGAVVRAAEAPAD